MQPHFEIFLETVDIVTKKNPHIIDLFMYYLFSFVMVGKKFFFCGKWLIPNSHSFYEYTRIQSFPQTGKTNISWNHPLKSSQHITVMLRNVRENKIFIIKSVHNKI